MCPKHPTPIGRYSILFLLIWQEHFWCSNNEKNLIFDNWSTSKQKGNFSFMKTQYVDCLQWCSEMVPLGPFDQMHSFLMNGVIFNSRLIWNMDELRSLSNSAHFIFNVLYIIAILNLYCWFHSLEEQIQTKFAELLSPLWLRTTHTSYRSTHIFNNCCW